jgi:hypothetical protein
MENFLLYIGDRWKVFHLLTMLGAKMKHILTCLVLCLLWVPGAQAGTEYVTLIKVLDDDDKGIIERSNGERWMIEKGVGALSFWRFEGKKILILSPGLFCGVGSKVILPDVGQEARIWDAEQIDGGGATTAGTTPPTDSELAVLALRFLGFYSPDDEDKNKSDVVLALKAFQRRSGLDQTGKISSGTQLALAKSISSREPATKESLALASLLLQSAKSLDTSPPPTKAPKKSGEGAAAGGTMESQLDGDFEGWEGGTIVKLTNGQIWQQTEYYYHYHYAFMPKVVILESGAGYKMIVDGVPKAIGVTRLK